MWKSDLCSVMTILFFHGSDWLCNSGLFFGLFIGGNAVQAQTYCVCCCLLKMYFCFIFFIILSCVKISGTVNLYLLYYFWNNQWFIRQNPHELNGYNVQNKNWKSWKTIFCRLILTRVVLIWKRGFCWHHISLKANKFKSHLISTHPSYCFVFSQQMMRVSQFIL